MTCYFMAGPQPFRERRQFGTDGLVPVQDIQATRKVSSGNRVLANHAAGNAVHHLAGREIHASGIWRSAVAKVKASLWNGGRLIDAGGTAHLGDGATVGREAATLCLPPEVTMAGEIVMVVPPAEMSAVTTNCWRTPVSVLVSGWTRYNPRTSRCHPA